ncbi:MAG: bifunctional alpha,alpha-trehalose-phosphate synthase (UDP-forming)/trehalose-phosphatase [bacterium]
MRMIIVSNRLPIHVQESKQGLTIHSSVGGVATGIASFLHYKKELDSAFNYLWVGWPGEVKDIKEVQKRIEEKFPYVPVFLSEKEMDLFYQGFCNKTIWPLFHYFPSLTQYDNRYWEIYKSVNQAYCTKVKAIIKPGDLVWIHDYHLLLLPQMLRQEISAINIAFFLHIPFPSFEVFRLLPHVWQREIIEGMLGSDLVGFHTHDYTQYFLRAALRVLGHEHNLGELFIGNRIVRADTFPMGIEYNKLHDTACRKASIEEEEKTRPQNGLKIILSIDRLDYTKGIIQRVRGFKLFLENNPEWHGKVSLHLIAVPSRIGVEQYQHTKKKLDEMIGRVNGDYGTTQWSPILYQYKSLETDDLIKTYLNGDIALITPLRDGMNLVAKEYLACRPDKTGVLILSEMAGAAKELHGALFINPNSIEEIAEAVHQALIMPKEDQIKRNEAMQEHLKNYDVVRWADEMLATLNVTQNKQSSLNAKYLSQNLTNKIVTKFKDGKQRLILLDYDGTLVPFAQSPELAVPDKDLIDLLMRLSSLPNILVFVISGRKKDFLDQWFKNLPIGLIAEHGAFIRTANNKTWNTLKEKDSGWKQKIIAIFDQYRTRVPGSFYEEKEYSVVWHYRAAQGDLDLVQTRAQELFDDMVSFTANVDVQVIQGNKVIEVRNNGINKGVAALSIISVPMHDFILAIGDDHTDEDMFKVLPASAHSIKVGFKKSMATYWVGGYQEVISLLKKMVQE